MISLSASQQQVRTAFLEQTNDGRFDCATDLGSGLPNLCYNDSDFYQLEQNTVFRNNWVFAAFAHQLQKAGDMMPIEVAGQPIVLVKNEALEIQAFHNVCRHRGAKLVCEARNRNKFVCPNHSWSYSLDGRLLMRPHFHGGEKHDLNKENCHRADLLPVHCVTWLDWVFVNLSGHAEPFEDVIKPVTDKLQGYDFSDLQFSDSLEFDINANWKLAIENFIEPYHVFSCHPWLNSFVGMDEREPPGFQGKILSCGYDFKQTDPARGGELPWFPDLPEDKHQRGDWFVLFPNFGFEIFPDQVDVFIATPISATQCRETIALYFVGEGATAERYADARAHVVKNWNDLNHEDIGVIERMQAGRSSEGFEGGVLSPYWDPVSQHFARLVSQAMSEP
ncbi:MAG: aromatic ring-hydroxylating dioxygenase subunit alpha [Pseudomonadota bacterium]